jgi:DNA-binding NarL/FixJ family response regulator
MNFDHQVVNVLIADSQFLVVEALKSLFREDEKYSVFGVVETKFELERALDEMGEGLFISDISTIDFDGIEDFKSVLIRFPKIHVLILTNSICKTDLVELTKAGFKNIIYKTVDRDELFSAIEAALKGKKYYSSELLDLMLDLNMGKQTIEESKALTTSEIEIVKLVSQGFTTKEIAFRKNISFHTVNTHRKNIFRKMAVSNASELIMKAIKSGWIDNIEYYI